MQICISKYWLYSIIEIEVLLSKLNRTSLFWTGPAEYSNKYIHLPEMVFALVCLGMSSVRLEHAGISRSALFSIDLSSSFRGRFWRGLKKFSWANPEVLSSIVSRMISFTMKTLNHFYFIEIINYAADSIKYLYDLFLFCSSNL